MDLRDDLPGISSRPILREPQPGAGYELARVRWALGRESDVDPDGPGFHQAVVGKHVRGAGRVGDAVSWFEDVIDVVETDGQSAGDDDTELHSVMMHWRFRTGCARLIFVDDHLQVMLHVGVHQPTAYAFGGLDHDLVGTPSDR